MGSRGLKVHQRPSGIFAGNSRRGAPDRWQRGARSMTAGSLMCTPRSILLDRGALVLSLRATALARPPFDPVDRIPDEPVMGSAALVVLYVTPLGLGEVEPAAGGGDHGAGPVQSSPIHALVQQGDLVHQVAE